MSQQKLTIYHQKPIPKQKTSEFSDITDAEFAEELPEQSEIADVLDEAATDIEPETSEFTDSDFAEVSEQDSSEIESLMDEATLDNTSGDTEIMNVGETYDMLWKLNHQKLKIL